MTAGALLIPAVALVGAVAAAPLGESIDLTEDQIAVIESADETYRQSLEDVGVTLHEAMQYRRQAQRGERFEENKDEMAAFLGVSVKDLEAAHEDRSIKELIEESGKSQDEIFAFFEEQRGSYIQSMLESGEITEEQAEQMLAREPKGPGMGGGQGGRMGGGFGPRF